MCISARKAADRNLKSSSALPLSMVSGFGATHKYWFQTETKLRTIAALSEFMAAGVLSGVSAEILGVPRCFGRVLRLRESAIGVVVFVPSCSSG